MHQNLKKNTLDKRLKMAKSFYEKRLDADITSNIELTKNLLIDAAPNYRRNSWLNLRAALATYWSVNDDTETAEQIRKIKYPVMLANKPKPKRCRRVTNDEFRAMIATCKTLKNHIALSVLLIARHTGCRPSEMSSIKRVNDSQFFVTSSKKTNDRGLDRLLQIADSNIADQVGWGVDIVHAMPTRTLQNNFEYLAEKTFPKRAHRPTIYSFRHQLGSQLKASGLGREVIAYILGHQSTKSVETYGDRRSSGNFKITVSPAVHNDEILKLVRQRHQLPPSHASNDDFFYVQDEGIAPNV